MKISDEERKVILSSIRTHCESLKLREFTKFLREQLDGYELSREEFAKLLLDIQKCVQRIGAEL